MTNKETVHWHPFNGKGEQLPDNQTLNLPPPPPWRSFNRSIPDNHKEKNVRQIY